MAKKNPLKQPVNAKKFDAVYGPGGAASVAALIAEPDAIRFVNEAYKHCKAIATDGERADLLANSAIGAKPEGKEKKGK